MQRTLDLLARALDKQPAAEWARQLDVSRSAFTNARKAGHLSPVIAGHLAIALDEDPREWMAQAAIEGEKDSPAKQTLARRLASWRKR